MFWRVKYSYALSIVKKYLKLFIVGPFTVDLVHSLPYTDLIFLVYGLMFLFEAKVTIIIEYISSHRDS